MTTPATGMNGLDGRRSLLWMAAFLAYPLGGVLATAVTGAVGIAAASVVGAAVAVAVIGGAQALALGLVTDRGTALRWVGASAVAGALGWGVAHAILPAPVGVTDAVVVGVITGLAIGIAQALVILSTSGRWAAWPVAFAAAWAVGYGVSTAIGVDTAAWPVFGASGAIVAQGILLVALQVMARTDNTMGEVAR